MTLFNKKLNQVAEAGHEVEILTVGQNIQYLSANTPFSEKLLTRVGHGGAGVFYRQNNDDKEWEETNSNSVPINMSEIELLTLTPNEKLKPEDTSYAFYCKLDNVTNSDRIVTFKVYDDGVLIAEKQIPVFAGQLLKQVVISGGIAGVIASGSNLVIKAFADVSGAIVMRGDVDPMIWYAVKTYLPLTVHNFASIMSDHMMSLQAESHVNQLINIYDNTLQFGTVLRNHRIDYNLTEDYFTFRKKGRIRFDVKLNFYADTAYERTWFWLEKKVGANWVREHHEDVYIEYNKTTEGLHFFSMFADVKRNDKYRIRYVAMSGTAMFKPATFHTHDGTNLSTPSVKVDIIQIL
jgi:hypothetical protein